VEVLGVTDETVSERSRDSATADGRGLYIFSWATNFLAFWLAPKKAAHSDYLSSVDFISSREGASLPMSKMSDRTRVTTTN
jgi:hypothetical protein